MGASDDETYGAARWYSVRRLFHQARDLPRSERAGFLERQCRGDVALRREVERLLDADDRSGGFLEPPVSLMPRELEKGQEVGPFRITGRLGAGNMGEVYRAERDAPFRMSVALKVIDAARVDDEVVWRFKHERQILAWLDHPNIARIIDGGTLDDGRPWFALEFVEGERIDRYCDRRKLTVRKRVELFRKACAAVSEAHGLAIVHRDLKPANILVTGDGEPKLLDFGIARPAEGEPVAGAEVQTPSAMEQLDSGSDSDLSSNALTPLYASPEQAARILRPEAGEHPPIGVRSDVYALGVVLYELLTGHPPYRKTEPWTALLRSVAEEVPRPPSEVVATERQRRGRRSEPLDPDSVAAERGVSPRALRRQLAGDLDAIVGHALKKQPAERYLSVAQLDTDLLSFLGGFPVMPRQSKTLYRAGRFLKRNLLRVVASAAVLAVGLIYFAMDWRAERRLLETREFLFNLTQIQIEELSDDEFARELRHAVAGYGDRVWLADILEEFGFDLEDRGHLRGALALFEENLAMRRRLLGAEHPDLAASFNNLAGAQLALGQFEAAENNYYRDLEIRERIYGSDSLEISRLLNNLAALYQHWGGARLAEAGPLLERSLRVRERALRLQEEKAGRGKSRGEDGVKSASLRVLATRNNLATQYLLERRFAEAEPLYRQVLAGLEALPDPGSVERRRAGVLRNLALVQLGQGASEGAEASARAALAIYRRNYLHWRIADAESVLGACLAHQERLEEARYFLEQSIEDLRTSHAAESRHVREAEERRARWLGAEARESSP